MCCDSPASSRPPSKPALLVVSLLVLPLVTLAACGKKGDPLPPLRDIPLRASDLALSQQGRLIVLDAPYPAVTVSGLALGGIDALELLQLVKPSTGDVLQPADATEFRAGAQVLLTLRGAELSSAVSGDRILIRVPLADELPEEPLAHYFGVRTLKGEETSDLSNLVGLVPMEPPPAPVNLQATARPESIELAWESPADDVEGFDVFRREARERGYGKPLQRLAGDARSFKDRGVAYGKKYIYTVRAIGKLEPLAWSAEAGEREIDYEDRFAPPLPKSFVALGERNRVRLRWEASPDADVAGYFIWRREPRRDDFHRIHEAPVTGIEYLDRGLTAGLAFEYRIQVVDRTGNESELSEIATATVR
jgi:hypothetical protein